MTDSKTVYKCSCPCFGPNQEPVGSCAFCKKKEKKAAEMEKMLEEIEMRVGIDGNLEHLLDWDFRDVWLSRCMLHIRTLQSRNKVLEGNEVKLKIAVRALRKIAQTGQDYPGQLEEVSIADAALNRILPIKKAKLHHSPESVADPAKIVPARSCSVCCKLVEQKQYGCSCDCHSPESV